MNTPDCCGEVVKSQALGKEYFYCRGCKREVPEDGWPVLEDKNISIYGISSKSVGGQYITGDFVVSSIDYRRGVIGLYHLVAEFEIEFLDFSQNFGTAIAPNVGDHFHGRSLPQSVFTKPGLRIIPAQRPAVSSGQALYGLQPSPSVQTAPSSPQDAQSLIDSLAKKYQMP